MKNDDTSKQLLAMEEKRTLLLDQCTRALCGDKFVDSKLLDEATGGRYSEGKGNPDIAEIKTLLLALRWLGIQEEKKVSKRRTAAKTNGTQPAKKRGRPAGSKNKDAEHAAPTAPATETTSFAEQPSA